MSNETQDKPLINGMTIDPALDPALDQLSRRTLLGRGIAGAASAVTAVAVGSSGELAGAQATETKIITQEITFPHRENGKTTNVKAHLASPTGNTKHGSVIVIHEIFGLTDHIRSVTNRLAEAGYTALAPDLFTREGEPPPMSGGFGPLMTFVGAISDKQIMGDLQSAVEFLKHQPHTNGKVGTVGFCWGGRISMLADADVRGLSAAVAYYGRISGEATEKQPKYPIDVVEKMHVPLLGHFGAEDTSIPPAEANKLGDALKAHRKPGAIYVYEGAGHAFNNDTRESYRPVPAKLAWDRTLDWFGKYLKS